jgi:hypothetical protein
MRNRLIRFALGGAVAVTAFAPAAPAAHAWACIGEVAEVVCTVYATGCRYVPSTGGKVDPHVVCTFQ